MNEHASRAEKLPTQVIKAADPQRLLLACVNSHYPDDSVSNRVVLRIIDLQDRDTAVISVRVNNSYYSATVSRKDAEDHCDLMDIFVDDSNLKHVLQKAVGKQGETKLMLSDLPELVPGNDGEHREFALHASKNTLIKSGPLVDTVVHRTLYHLSGGKSRFVTTLSSGQTFLFEDTTTRLDPFVVPGDFVAYEDDPTLWLVIGRTMPRPDQDRVAGELAPIELPDENGPGLAQ